MTLAESAKIAEISEFHRVTAGYGIDAETRSLLGQYMTPLPIARFMASLFNSVKGDVHLLDAGAGVGSLTAAFTEKLNRSTLGVTSLSLTCYEIDEHLRSYLIDTLLDLKSQMHSHDLPCETRIFEDDFILSNEQPVSNIEPFSHVIMNPPYKMSDVSAYETDLSLC